MAALAAPAAAAAAAAVVRVVLELVHIHFGVALVHVVLLRLCLEVAVVCVALVCGFSEIAGLKNRMDSVALAALAAAAPAPLAPAATTLGRLRPEADAQWTCATRAYRAQAWKEEEDRNKQSCLITMMCNDGKVGQTSHTRLTFAGIRSGRSGTDAN